MRTPIFDDLHSPAGQGRNRRRSAGALWIVLAGAVMLAGCSQQGGDERGAGPVPQVRWEAVFVPEFDSGSGGADSASAWWESRRDTLIAAREASVPEASTDWPQASRPTLERARTLFLQTRPESVLYFRHPRR
ncbi:MAG: hypothetical protein AB7G11_14825 [Phycisphaerales bacterium]